MSDGTTLDVSESVTTVTISEDNTTVNITPAVTTIEARGIAVSSGSAGVLPFTPYGNLTATNVQSALEQLADQDFRTDSTPTGANVQEGDSWYDTDDNEVKIYRETSPGVFQWVPIIVGTAGDGSDLLDAGAF